MKEKSTLLKYISGLEKKPDGGKVKVQGHKILESNISNIAREAINNGIDPYTALAISMQETGIGTMGRKPNILYHINPDYYNTSEAGPKVGINSINKQMHYAKNLQDRGIIPQGENYLIQGYNGYGKINIGHPDLEGATSMYGQEIPDSGIDFRKTPLYGDRILDIKNNLRHNNNINNLVQPEQYPRVDYNNIVDRTWKNKLEEGGTMEEYKKGGIHIKPSHVGKFTAYKKRTGKTTEEALHSKDPHVRAMANFARNASHWKHEYGGKVDYFAYGGHNYNDFLNQPRFEQTNIMAEGGMNYNDMLNQPRYIQTNIMDDGGYTTTQEDTINTLDNNGFNRTMLGANSIVDPFNPLMGFVQDLPNRGFFGGVKALAGAGAVLSGATLGYEKAFGKHHPIVDYYNGATSTGKDNINKDQSTNFVRPNTNNKYSLFVEGGELDVFAPGGQNPWGQPQEPSMLDWNKNLKTPGSNREVNYYKTSPFMFDLTSQMDNIANRSDFSTSKPFDNNQPLYNTYPDTGSNIDTKNISSARYGDGRGAHIAGNALTGLGMINDVVGETQNYNKYRELLRKLGNTNNKYGVSNPINPFGDYTVNPGVGPNFQLTKNTPINDNMKDGGHWIQKAVNPAHKGYCTPMSKSTCTPKRKALAETFKKHHGFHEEGGIVNQDRVNKEVIKPTTSPQKDKSNIIKHPNQILKEVAYKRTQEMAIPDYNAIPLMTRKFNDENLPLQNCDASVNVNKKGLKNAPKSIPVKTKTTSKIKDTQYKEGGEYYLSDEDIQYIMKCGGQIEYLD